MQRRLTPSRRSLRAALVATALSAALCTRAEVAAPEPAIAAPSAPDDSANLAELPDAVRLRLRDRETVQTRVVGAIVSSARRYSLDTQVLQRIAALGHEDMDTYVVPSARVGETLLVIQFKPKSEDARAEAIAMFRALEGEVLATRADFVALKAGVYGLTSEPDGYDWLFWHTPEYNWVVIKTAPKDYFEAKLRSAKQPETAANIDHLAIANYLARLARISFAEGENDEGAKQMREALEHVDAAPADAPSRALLELELVRALTFAAAEDGEETQVNQYIARYAAIAAKSGAQFESVPVRITAPDGDWETFLDAAVTLEFDVLTDGRTASVVVLGGSSSATFAAAARQSVERWRFFPAVANGQVIVSKRRWVINTAANNLRTVRKR